MRVWLLGTLLIASQGHALAQQQFSDVQLRVVRQIASATAMADLCGAGISRGTTTSALRSVGLTVADFESPYLRDERAKQRIALMSTYEQLSMTIMGRQAALERQCSNLARMYGRRGIAIPGLANVAGR